MSAGDPVAHERRVIRRLEARGEPGLGEALVGLDGSVVGDRWRLESLYAVGSEGAVYVARDVEDPAAPYAVAKVALLPLHRPFDLTDEEIAQRRASLREEATNLSRAASAYMPKSLGLHEFENPALEAAWGGEFAEPEPCLVMEMLPGFDLDFWLARMHSSRVPKSLLRRQLDHVAVVVLTGLLELQDHGFFYTDLRPGNVRIRGRSRERVRLMDAGSLVRADDRSGKFPHVPAYLPPELFETGRSGGLLLPSPAIQAVMAGRTLFEVATGRVPLPGEPVETSSLYGLTVSPSVAETVERLCRGSFPDVGAALAYLSENMVQGSDARGRATSGRAAAAGATSPRSAARIRRAASMAAPAPAPAPAPTRVPPPKPKLDLHSALAHARSPVAPVAPAASAAPTDVRAPEPVVPHEFESGPVPSARRPGLPEFAPEEVAEALELFEEPALASVEEPVPARSAEPVAARATAEPVTAGVRAAARSYVQPSAPTAVPLAQAFAVAPKHTRGASGPPTASLPPSAPPAPAPSPRPESRPEPAPPSRSRAPSQRSLPAVSAQRPAPPAVPLVFEEEIVLSDEAEAQPASPSRSGPPPDSVLPAARPSLFRRLLALLGLKTR